MSQAVGAGTDRQLVQPLVSYLQPYTTLPSSAVQTKNDDKNGDIYFSSLQTFISSVALHSPVSDDIDVSH